MCYARRQRSSWARIKLSKSLYQNILKGWFNLLPSLALSFFYFCLSSILILRISEIRFKLSRFVLLSCCSIFKDHFAPAFAAARILYHFSSPLSIPFAKVFHLFFRFFQGSSWQPPFLRTAWLLYHQFRHLSTPFFIFLSIWSFWQVLCDISYDIVKKYTNKKQNQGNQGPKSIEIGFSRLLFRISPKSYWKDSVKLLY